MFHFLAATRRQLGPMSREGVAKLQQMLLQRIRNSDHYVNEVQGRAVTSDDPAANVAAAPRPAAAAGVAIPRVLPPQTMLCHSTLHKHL